MDDAIRRLESDHGPAPTVDKTWACSADTYEHLCELLEQRALGGAGVWLTNDAGEVLLVRNEGDVGWADPGGKREPGELYERTATREVREETGVDCRVTGLRELHVIEHRLADGDAVVYSLIPIFDGEHVDGEPRPREGEIAAVGWFSEPPENVLYEEVRTRPYPAE